MCYFFCHLVFLQVNQTKLQTACLFVTKYTNFSQLLPFWVGRVSCSPGWPKNLLCSWGWPWILDLPAAISKVLGLHAYVIMPSAKFRFLKTVFLYVAKSERSYFQCNLKTGSVNSAKKPDSQMFLMPNFYTDTYDTKVLMVTFLPIELFLLLLWDRRKTVGSKFIQSQSRTRTDNVLCSQGWPWV